MSRVKGKSDLNDFTLAAQACLPIISAVLVEIKNQRYCERCFLIIDLPTNVASHKACCNYCCIFVSLACKKLVHLT